MNITFDQERVAVGKRVRISFSMLSPCARMHETDLLRVIFSLGMSCISPSRQASYSNEVLRRETEQAVTHHFRSSDLFGLPQAVDSVHPTDGLLDSLAHFELKRGLLGDLLTGSIVIDLDELENRFIATPSYCHSCVGMLSQSDASFP